MQNTKGYLIIDENGRYVVGYVANGNEVRYIAYEKNESCAIRPFLSQESVAAYIKLLQEQSTKIGDNHIFNYKEIWREKNKIIFLQSNFDK